ncbi:MAG: hydratase [Deltaproteobacteria bacterium]|nr:MAG: hydratase [Deltaproteobacteria bacterium]
MKRVRFPRFPYLMGIILLLTAAYSVHGVVPQSAIDEMAKNYIAKKPVTPVSAHLTLNEAMAVQEAFVSRIKAVYGPPVGYKAGLTSPAAQKKFGVTHPLLGVLLEKMIIRKTSHVMDAKFGVLPLAEGDLVVRVGDDKINQAESNQEILAALDAVYPFIELPDIFYVKGTKLDGPALSAINVGARYGLLGDPIPLSPTEDWMKRLKTFKLEILDKEGKVLATGTGANLLGNPLNVVRWIRDELKKRGKLLKKGDLLSLGTVTKLMPVKPGTTIRARYTGLDPKGPVEISVTFK